MPSLNALNSYKDIDYTLKRSARKTTSIYIERDGSVSVLAPEPFDQEKIEQIIEKKRSWIYRNLAEWEDLNRTHIQRQYVNGESFLYLGRNYRLQLVEDKENPLIFRNGQFFLSRNAVPDAPELFKQFYKTKLLKKLEDRLSLYASKMSQQPAGIRVMELKNRWGSCSSQGSLNFHWKCAMLPLSVLDYVIVHELAHIQHQNHSPAFWRVVEKVMPGYEEQKNWLKFNGASMSL
ncbi:metal-dependent hydrolase [Gammaproteobacteria bacterium 42_54_T18]|nr:metal-dependent hydrolase [Gammaproteobacteria bacterium 42_54_T18]